MKQLTAAALLLCLLAGMGVANAKPIRQQQIITCDQRGCGKSESYRHGDDNNLTNHSVGMGSLGGCRSSLGCGCNAAVRWLGLSAKEAARQGYNAARAWLGKGSPAASDCVGCFMISRRSGGGHVGKVIGRDANGNPIVESYANARLGWTVATYPKSRVLGYVDMGWVSAGR
jgi:hypothetical protein